MRSLNEKDLEEFQEADAKEWNAIVKRGAVKIHSPKEAAALRQEFPGRFLRSRVMRIWKEPAVGPRKAKSRWRVAGQDDPDRRLGGAVRRPVVAAPAARCRFPRREASDHCDGCRGGPPPLVVALSCALPRHCRV